MQACFFTVVAKEKMRVPASGTLYLWAAFCFWMMITTIFAIYPDSAIPALGASGAVSGLFGAFVRLYPSSRVLVVVPIVIDPDTAGLRIIQPATHVIGGNVSQAGWMIQDRLDPIPNPLGSRAKTVLWERAEIGADGEFGIRVPGFADVSRSI